ncbi:hypothetical protein Tco_0150973 [Tanacetum coccineum]
MDSSNQDPVVLFEEKGGEFVQEEKHLVSEMPLATSDREGIRTKHSTQETALNTLSPDEKQDEVGDELAASASHNQGIMSKATDTIQEGCPLSERRNVLG